MINKSYQISLENDDPFYDVYYKKGTWYWEVDDMCDPEIIDPETVVEVIVGTDAWDARSSSAYDLLTLLKNKKLHYDYTGENAIVAQFSEEPMLLVDYLDDSGNWAEALMNIINGDEVLYTLSKPKLMKLNQLKEELSI